MSKEFEEWFENYVPDNKEREQCRDAWHDGRREGYKQGKQAADTALAEYKSDIQHWINEAAFQKRKVESKDKALAEKDGEIERLREALQRLASMEAFTISRAVDSNNPADKELIARINYAELALKGHDHEPD